MHTQWHGPVEDGRRQPEGKTHLHALPGARFGVGAALGLRASLSVFTHAFLFELTGQVPKYKEERVSEAQRSLAIVTMHIASRRATRRCYPSCRAAKRANIREAQ